MLIKTARRKVTYLVLAAAMSLMLLSTPFVATPTYADCQPPVGGTCP